MQAAESVGRSRETVREAAAFFVEQILLFPDADSYRVLGARPDATNGELRRNMALLLRWLHPDLDRLGERSVLAIRVTRAWNDLKTQQHRAAYDRLKRISRADKSFLSKKGRPHAKSKKQDFNSRRHNTVPYATRAVARRPFHIYPVRIGLLRRILLLLFGKTAP